ncbi:acetyltransferase [Chryseobacterium sp. 09-1422]|uniref:Acetyltransferase n=1 Tax=Chryseobacterium kimseyorum TaxID=2984028 RepID=A0ABT3I371_9FLAO|nr:acetyltransferase [Chryseobacterium kimseyorum]MCW3170515.1 acetyltransferase [Chryseobacterium kimseyorum]
MIIVGAKGFAKEILEIFHQQNALEGLAFYDDVTPEIGDLLYNRFPILKSKDQVLNFFGQYGFDFTIGIGNPKLRSMLYEKFLSWGGDFKSTISAKAILGSYDVKIGDGSNILDSAVFSNSTSVGTGCIVYYNVTITHDCVVGDFVELSPGVTLLGGCHIGAFTQIGSNSTVFPKIKIGRNVIIGAGTLVNKDIPDNCVAVGIPARIIKQI